MDSKNDSGYIYLIGCGILAMIGYGIISDFAKLFNLSIEAGGAVALRLIFLGFILFLSQKEYLIFRLEDTWPLFAAFLWFAWWPALDFWAGKRDIWWATSEFQLDVLAGIVVTGYCLKKVFKNDNC